MADKRRWWQRKEPKPKGVFFYGDAKEFIMAAGYTRLLDCPEIQACVNVYADLISSMTIHLMENTDDGDKRIKDGLARKVDIEPNQYMTRKTFIANIVRTLLTEGEGNQVTYPSFDFDGHLEDLEPWPARKVSFAENPDGGYTIKYGEIQYAPDEVLHFVINPDPDLPWKGTGYTTTLREVTKGLRQAGQTKQNILSSPKPSLIIRADFSEELQSREGREMIRDRYITSSEDGVPWIIPAESLEVSTIQPLGLKELAIAENMELDIRTAAAVMRVPAFLVGVGEFKKDEYNAFINYSIMPLALAIQQELTRKLLVSSTRYFKLNPRSLYAYDLAETVGAGIQLLDRGALRRNELRDWIGITPDKDMHEILMLENFLPVDKLGLQKKLEGLVFTDPGGDD